MQDRPQMILTAALMHGLGNQPGAWRVRQGPASDYVSPALYAQIARKAEEGKLHALFLAEQMTNRDTGTERPCGALDTVAVLSYMAAVTNHVGLVGTGSTTYNEPYDLARRFATLDHLAQGRVGWNSVTTANPATAEMFGSTAHPEARERYSRADEFIEVVIKLWESWEPDALVGDKENAIFADPAKIHAIDHVGESFSCRGPLPFMRSVQGRPVIFHAGSSPQGRDQAARFADVVFTAQHTIGGARDFRSDMRRRTIAHGRHPDSIKILPGMNVILGETDADARRKKAALDNALTVDQLLALLSKRTGVNAAILKDHLDRPFPIDALPPDDQLQNGAGWRQSVIGLAVEEELTVRQLLSRAPSAHHHLVGTARIVADAMEERLEARAADGFTMMVDVLPDGLNDIVHLLVPELQRRGIFQKEYGRSYLRDMLNLAARVPANASERERVPQTA